MSTLDHLITSDLGALGEDSRRAPSSLDDALRTTGIYRDDRPGAEARRDALAKERRRELVMMPLTLAHVFAHRVGRAAAGVAALVCAGVMIVMLGDPLALRLAAWFVPGLNVGMCIMLAALAIVCVYVIATWVAEAWFARTMRQAIRTGGDAYQDLDQLARGPLEIAQAAVRRVDGLAVGLLLAGITSVTLAFGYVVSVVGSFHNLSRTLSIVGILEIAPLAKNLDALVLAVAGASIAAFVVGNRCVRETTEGFMPGRGLASWMTLVAAVIVGLGTLYSAFHMIVGLGFGRVLPSTATRFGLAAGATVSIFLFTAWALLWWRRREQARIVDL
ncbi:MAG: hypothetical protein H0T89_02890 [Deltaproteobacteria bacterium]|nr:hypothetical protein [Deltaproteobacteria bacterium]MDQ3300208.1 hypothetical protein [Myxococcota bacterium]